MRFLSLSLFQDMGGVVPVVQDGVVHQIGRPTGVTQYDGVLKLRNRNFNVTIDILTLLDTETKGGTAQKADSHQKKI